MSRRQLLLELLGVHLGLFLVCRSLNDLARALLRLGDLATIALRSPLPGLAATESSDGLPNSPESCRIAAHAERQNHQRLIFLESSLLARIAVESAKALYFDSPYNATCDLILHLQLHRFAMRSHRVGLRVVMFVVPMVLPLPQFAL